MPLEVGHAHLLHPAGRKHLQERRAAAFLDVDLDLVGVARPRRDLFAEPLADALLLLGTAPRVLLAAVRRGLRADVPCCAAAAQGRSGAARAFRGNRKPQQLAHLLLELGQLMGQARGSAGRGSAGTGGGGAPARLQDVDDAVERHGVRAVPDRLGHLGLDQPHRHLHQVTDHGVDVPADITYFGELRGLDLQERRPRQLRQPPGDLGLSHPRGTDHKDVFRDHLVAQVVREHPAAVSIPERDGDRPLGLFLPDDELVQLGDDLPRGQLFDEGHPAAAAGPCGIRGCDVHTSVLPLPLSVAKPARWVYHRTGFAEIVAARAVPRNAMRPAHGPDGTAPPGALRSTT
jgi:hypothetical protein